MRIDAHQHFWKIDRGDYGWLAELPKINRDYLPRDLAPLLREAGVDKTVLVQCAETIDETLFMLGLAAENDFIAGVVGWVNFAAPNAAQQIASLAQDAKLVGLRPMLQDMDDKAWILGDALSPGFQAMQKHALRFDALIKPPHLPHMPALCAQYPEMPIVIDHCAKPYIARGEMEPWRAQMQAIAAHSNAHCKLSGLITEAGESWDAAKLKPYADAVIEMFGPARVMWGSDWPVCLLAGEYGAWRAAAAELTASLSAAERDSIFGGTAAKFYGLN